MEREKLLVLKQKLASNRETMEAMSAPLDDRGLTEIANKLIKPICGGSCYGALVLTRGWINHAGAPFLRKREVHV